MPVFLNIDEYIASSAPEVRDILHKIRVDAKQIVPAAQECISYSMPALKHKKVFFYFAAFKKHIGIYPPVKLDTALIKELQPYRNEKGNLSFPLKQPIPYELIKMVVLALSREYGK
jgi:uncharacterized protein YdhG (YjbR/CyaY superfamily)